MYMLVKTAVSIRSKRKLTYSGYTLHVGSGSCPELS